MKPAPVRENPRRQGRFAYYAKLDAGDRRTYRASDRITEVPLPDAASLVEDVRALEAALAGGKRVAVERAAGKLCLGLTTNLGVIRVAVKVRSVRPSEHGGELHGLYTWEQGKVPVIEVWMRTARNHDVVRFRTFLRTLLHEVCHHLDFHLHGLPDTFHTAGFFRRESSLMRQLAPALKRRAPRAKADEEPAPAPVQLGLFS